MRPEFPVAPRISTALPTSEMDALTQRDPRRHDGIHCRSDRDRIDAFRQRDHAVRFGHGPLGHGAEVRVTGQRIVQATVGVAGLTASMPGTSGRRSVLV